MNRTLNKIIHFQGSKQTWESKIANGEWTNNIVFGLVQDETGLYSKRYYAGRDSRNNDYEVKSSVTVASLASANELVLSILLHQQKMVHIQLNMDRMIIYS